MKLVTIAQVLFTVTFLGSACVTTSEKEQLEAEVFDLRTRMLQLEMRLKGGVEEVNSHKKSLASSTSEVERLDLEIRKLRGELDSLKVGVKTGELPGTSEQDPSIGRSLRDIGERLTKVEEDNKQIHEALEAAKSAAKKSAKNSTKPATAKTGEKLKSLADLEQAYAQKKYSIVATEAAALAKTAKKSERSELLFLQAESLFKLGKLQDAALIYNEYLEQGKTDKLAFVKMRMGDCFRNLGDKGTAKLYYEELVDQFPTTAEAQKAKERLSKL